jgi:hypothetical protein
MKAWLEALTGRHGLDELFLGRSLIRELATRREATAADDAEGLETTRRRKARLGPEDEPDAEVRAFLTEMSPPSLASLARQRQRRLASATWRQVTAPIWEAENLSERPRA